MTAAENMALDDALLELKGKGRSPNTVHFLQFAPRSVLVGFHQSVSEEIRTGYCREKGIEINRRITGGGAIFFDESQIGWEVICDKQFFNQSFVTDKLFSILCEPVVTALDMLGVRACFRPRNDIEINGRKISGTGGTESEGAFLFHGSLLTDFDVDTMLKSLKIPVEKLRDKEIDSVKERVTCLKWELGYTPTPEEIKTAICRGFERHLKIKLVAGGLTDDEKLLFQKKLPYYQSRSWIDQVKPQYHKREAFQGIYKCSAGLIRLTLVVNLLKQRLKDIYITGDFLSFPSSALFDLESQLRGMRLDREHIKQEICQFFDQGKIRIPGMTAVDFIKPLELAFEQISITKSGIPLEHCN
ncbi:lipoyl protein ligase domain-containing protein [Desulfocicer vacuolatum]|nr:lipoate protein ligase C-terminal domain-containing protein [Desulfocicer vacuolatum]